MAGTIISVSARASEADIQRIFDSAKDGDTISLPKDAVFLISKGLTLDVSSRSITVDFNGSTLQQAGDVTVFQVLGGHAPGASAKLSETAGGAVTVTYTGASSVRVGDFVKIYSDDVLPNDQGARTRLGQALEVVAVNNNTLTLSGDLEYASLYKTNVRASAYESGKAVITDGTIRGDQSHPTWTTNLLDLRSTVDAVVSHITVRDGNSMGINFVDSVNGLVSQSAAINLTDDTANGHYGYGVHSASSVGTTVDGFYAEKVRHAVDNNAIGLNATHVNPSKYGADIGMNASNVVAVDNTSFAFSWHSEGRLSAVTDSLVFDSFGVLGARGVDNTFANVSGSGNGRGIVFFEYGDGDGKRISVSNVSLKENYGYAYYKQNNPTENTIDNSFFEILSNKVTIAPSDPSVKITNTTLKIGAFATDENLQGTWASDQILGGFGQDLINGNAGKDYIWGGLGSDTLYGGSGSDRFAYREINEAGDTIKDFTVGAGGDVIDVSQMYYYYGWKSTAGHTRFIQSGADTLFQVDLNGGSNSFVTVATLEGVTATELTDDNLSTDIDITNNGEKYVPLVKSTDNGKLSLPDAFADLTGLNLQIGSAISDTLLGTANNDLLIGTDNRDTITAYEGNDVLVGGGGADILMGGAGSDTASYANAATAIKASLINPAANTGDAAGDSYRQIENLTGSAFADALTGNDGVNMLIGGKGNDVLYGLGGSDTLFGGDGDDQLFGGARNDVLNGGAGNDYIVGGAGYDKLTGGAGSDKFLFEGPTGATVEIADFASGVDKILLKASDYGVARVSDFEFVSDRRPSPVDNSPTLLYNSTSGSLWFDADGTGWRSAVNIANFTNQADLALGDFLVI